MSDVNKSLADLTLHICDIIFVDLWQFFFASQNTVPSRMLRPETGDRINLVLRYLPDITIQ